MFLGAPHSKTTFLWGLPHASEYWQTFVLPVLCNREQSAYFVALLWHTLGCTGHCGRDGLGAPCGKDVLHKLLFHHVPHIVRTWRHSALEGWLFLVTWLFLVENHLLPFVVRLHFTAKVRSFFIHQAQWPTHTVESTSGSGMT
ncbi:hypothetical protein Tco_0488828 [Tanacetum coccineum]